MCPFEFWIFFENDLVPRKKILLASQKNIGLHTSTLEYASTANISITPPSHNHGLAMFTCITPFWNLRPPPVYSSHSKRSFWRSDFLLKYHQNPWVLKRWSMKKRLQESLQIKGEVNILRGLKHFNFKNIDFPFSLATYMTWVVPFFLPMSSTYLSSRG
jgi:hypothetical protein